MSTIAIDRKKLLTWATTVRGYCTVDEPNDDVRLIAESLITLIENGTFDITEDVIVVADDPIELVPGSSRRGRSW